MILMGVLPLSIIVVVNCFVVVSVVGSVHNHCDYVFWFLEPFQERSDLVQSKAGLSVKPVEKEDTVDFEGGRHAFSHL